VAGQARRVIGVAQAFSSQYGEARTKFLEGAARAGLAIESLPHPLPGPRGEALALDVALDGPANAERLLIFTSACHGVEGHCGSGVQVFALHDDEWRDKARAAGVSVLYVHALNPHGFAHTRRVTQENVDLNRNFQDFTQALPVNAPYRDIHALMLPDVWPPTPHNEAAVADYVARHGAAALQSAVSRGQHEFADGLFFGGTAPTWSNQCWRQVLRTHAGTARRLAWIDLHTGLGPNGIGERIFACRDDAAALQRARAWWGEGVTSIYDGSSTSAYLTGMAFQAIYDECPQAEYTGLALEFGTVPFDQVNLALRADHWLHLHPEAPAALAAEIKAQLLAAFYTDTDAWKGQIISQSRQAMFQAVEGLAR
jgi:hypothetical protein